MVLYMVFYMVLYIIFSIVFYKVGYLVGQIRLPLLLILCRQATLLLPGLLLSDLKVLYQRLVNNSIQ